MPAAIEQYVPQCEPAGARGAWAVWGACVLAASVFLGLIVCAPVARAHGHEAFALFCYQVFKGLCHQLPARSFYVAGEPLAVCARCFGIYAGFALGVLCYPLVRSLSRTDAPARVWLLLAALPTGIDFMLGWTGLWANTHTSRALTGALLGAVAALYVVPGLVALSLHVRAKRQAKSARSVAVN
jgi:uncharacterized membrane protein